MITKMYTRRYNKWAIQRLYVFQVFCVVRSPSTTSRYYRPLDRPAPEPTRLPTRPLPAPGAPSAPPAPPAPGEIPTTAHRPTAAHVSNVTIQITGHHFIELLAVIIIPTVACFKRMKESKICSGKYPRQG